MRDTDSDRGTVRDTDSDRGTVRDRDSDRGRASIQVRAVICGSAAGLWSKLTLFANVSLFLALPLAFLLDEASGYFGPSAHHRLLESLLVRVTAVCMAQCMAQCV